MTMRRAGRLTCAFFFLALLGACATSPQTRLLIDRPPDLPSRVELEAVPFFPQQQYHCGPAALAAVMNYRGKTVSPGQIADRVYLPELKGSLQVEIVAAARQFDLLPVQLEGQLESLLREVAAGNPVFLLQNLGLDLYPVWHYEILIGYDLERRQMILRSGQHRRLKRDFGVFEKTWGRAGYWALALVETDAVPVTSSAAAYLNAVVGMEQVGRIDSAHRAYDTARRRWTENWLAHSGFANTAYALGEYVDAEAAYREALSLDANRAEIWNNLAYALKQLGRHEASMAAIRRALELDPENPNFRSSLDELSTWH